MPAVFFIDGDAVNDREDWWQHAIPGEAPRSEEGFPGDPNLYVIKGEAYPCGLAVTGWLQADSIDDLHDEIEAYSRMQGDADLHTVQIHGRTWSSMDFIRLIIPRPRSVAFVRSGEVWVRTQATFLFQQLEHQ